MKNTFNQMLIIVTILLSSANLWAEELCQPKKEFDSITDVVSKNFYDKSFKGLDWLQKLNSYREKVDCSADDSSIAAVVNDLLAELKTSHTGLYTPKDLKYWGLKSIFSGDLTKFKIAFSGIWPVKIENEWYVHYVLQGSAAERAGILAGDKIISLNGEKFEPLAFQSDHDSVLRITSDGNFERDIKLRGKSASLQMHFLKATKKSEQIIEFNNKKIGYIHLFCGTHDEFLNALDNSLKRFKKKKVDGIILDLRDGFGGAYPDYLKLLTEDSFLKKLPKVFLINGGVTSGKEWLAALIKRDKIGKLVGTKTAGAFMAGGPFDILNKRFFLYLAVKEFVPPNVPTIEGVGVAPDEIVLDCKKFCKAKDLQLEKALQVLVW